MLKKLALCLTGIACIALSFPVFVAADGSWIINRSHSVITITNEGDVHVHETVTLDLGKTRKTGLRRTFPLKYTNSDTIWFAQIADLKIQRNKVDEIFSTIQDDTQLIVDIGDVRLDFEGQQTYDFDYKIIGALRRSTTSDIAFLAATGGWETTVEQSTSILKLPQSGLINQQCKISPVNQSDDQVCQAIGLKKSEARFVSMKNLRPGGYMYIQADYDQGLVPIATVKPPSFVDWIEVYQKPLLALSAISTGCLLVAGVLWLKARKIKRLAQRKNTEIG